MTCRFQATGVSLRRLADKAREASAQAAPYRPAADYYLWDLRGPSDADGSAPRLPSGERFRLI